MGDRYVSKIKFIIKDEKRNAQVATIPITCLEQ